MRSSRAPTTEHASLPRFGLGLGPRSQQRGVRELMHGGGLRPRGTADYATSSVPRLGVVDLNGHNGALKRAYHQGRQPYDFIQAEVSIMPGKACTLVLDGDRKVVGKVDSGTALI